jgi:hypothetical protein
MHKIDSLVRQKAQVLAAAGLPVECLDDDYDPAGIVPDLPQSHTPAPLRPKL